MQELPELLKGLAALAWPAIVLAMIWLFRPAVASIMESAKTREFSVEIGGQRLSTKEANDQNRALIADLQSKVSELAQLKRPCVLVPRASVRHQPTSTRS